MEITLKNVHGRQQMINLTNWENTLMMMVAVVVVAVVVEPNHSP